MGLPWKPEAKEAVVKDDWVSILARKAGYQSLFLPIPLIAGRPQQAPPLLGPLTLSGLRALLGQRKFSSFGQLTLTVLFASLLCPGPQFSHSVRWE